MVLAAPGFSAAPTNDRPPDSLHEAANQNWVRRIVDVVNLLVKGKMNASLLVTLNASVATTDVIDARITVNSVLLPQPLTANAAAAAYETPYILTSAQNSGFVTLNHVNDANTDKTFNLLIIG